MVSEWINDLCRADMITQNGECIIFLSRYLLSMEEGERLLLKKELARVSGTGVGTVQNALKKLEDLGAVKLVSRGHLGTFIESLDKKLLWKHSLYGYVRGTMPLPYSGVLVGMATGIHNSFPEEGPMLRMSYVRGGRVRIQNLMDGLDDFTVCSLYSARIAMETYQDVRIFMEFDDNTYMGKPALLLRKGIKLADGIRIGIDGSSYDQELISRSVCRNYQVEFVKVQYNNLFYMMEKGNIDGGVWSLLDTGIQKFDGTVEPLHGNLVESGQGAGQAVILTNERSQQKLEVIRSLLDKEKIEETQKAVMENRAIPNY